MANSTGWDDVSGTQKKKGTGQFKEYPRLKFARVEYDQPFKFRPLHEPVGFWLYMRQHKDGSWRRAICADPDTCSTAKRHNIIPTERHAIVVINRATQEAELLEFTPGVYEKFKLSKKASGMSPGSSTEGADFVLTKTKKAIKSGETRTTYELECVGRTPLTSEEKEKIVGPLLDFFKDNRLSFIYKATPDDKIEEILFGERDSRSSPAPASVQPQVAPKSSSVSATKQEVPKEDEVNGDTIPF